MIVRAAVASIFLLLASAASGQSTSMNLEMELRKAMEKKVVLLRHFYEGKTIRYQPDGTAERSKEGIWTIHGYVKVRKVQIKDDTVLIDGERLAAIYDARQNNMQLSSYKELVRLELPVSADLKVALMRMFVASNEDATTLVPEYWKEFAQTHAIADLSKAPTKPPKDDRPQLEAGVYRVGGSVKPPVAVSQPEPEFTQFARQFRITGTTTVSLIVDEKGQPTKISIIRPLGSGLDEKAVEAVMRWRFKPGTKNGVPVKTQIAVEMDFRFQ